VWRAEYIKQVSANIGLTGITNDLILSDHTRIVISNKRFDE